MAGDRKHRVFVVEDDPRLRSVLVRLLTDWGYETGMASDGVEALERIPRFHPSVVISDLRMPRMDGLQLLSRLRAMFPDLSFILLSGYEHLTTAQIAVAAGACRFLEKPLDP